MVHQPDGGLELPAKVVQRRLGHSSIAVTLDTYGHLFPRGDDGAELVDAERRCWVRAGILEINFKTKKPLGGKA